MLRWIKGFPALALLLGVLAVFSQAQAGEFTVLPTLGGIYSNAYDLSRDGTTVVGYADDENGYHRAFLLQGGQMTDLGTLGGNYSYAQFVSADGAVVVGHAYTGNGYYHAFRWSDGVMTDLGTLGGTYSYANDISDDGNVVVGYSYLSGNNYQRAFRWVDGVITNLGTLGGNWSYATAVSADGAVVAGHSDLAGGFGRAFRWVDGVMTDLGTLGGNYSYAYDLSADGSVVVGYSHLPGDNSHHAFRWVDGTMSDLGTLGGNYSYAQFVSSDGAVVVGHADTGGGNYHAFRWSNGAMADLGTLGGTYSYAQGMSSDGAVIVGNASTETSSTAFRWHASTGMLSVADWLAEYGVSVEGLDLSYARAVSDDGKVIIGHAHDANGYCREWLARAGALIDPAQWMYSVSGSRQIFHTGTQLANLALHGSHHRPLMTYDLIGPGPGFWVTGDLGGYGDGRNTTAGSAEIGLYNDYAANRVRAGLGLGYAGQRQDLPFSGSADLDGGYVVGEVNWQALSDTKLILSATGFYGLWDAEVKRGYLNGSEVERSRGNTDVQSFALRLKADWLDAACIGNLHLNPYLGLTLSHTRVDGYSEQGGGVPASFDTQKHDALEMRLGMAGVQSLTDSLRLRLTLEGVHRFDGRGPSLSGREIGGFGFAFDLPGDKIDRTWVRGSGELEYRIDQASMVGLSLSGASQGQDPDISGAITYRRSL
jgi:probable HAF family extracellular repeat protein